MNLGPLQPYVWMLKAGAALAIASTLFVSGCNHGKRAQAEKDRKEISQKDDALRSASISLQGAADALNVVSSETKAAQAAAQAQAQATADAVKVAQAQAKTFKARMSKAESDLEAAKAADPDCRKLLETPSCAAFR